MRSLKNLDSKESIRLKKLIFEESWDDKFDTYFTYFIFIMLILFSSILIYHINPNSSNDTMGYYIFPFVIIFCAYGIYCKFSEKYLKEIPFNIQQDEAKRRVEEYGLKNGFRISKKSSNLIFLNEPLSSISYDGEEKTSLIFFKKKSILYTVIQNGRRTNAPVLISQHTLKRDLKKILNQTDFVLKPNKSYFDKFFND